MYCGICISPLKDAKKRFVFLVNGVKYRWQVHTQEVKFSSSSCSSLWCFHEPDFVEYNDSCSSCLLFMFDLWSYCWAHHYLWLWMPGLSQSLTMTTIEGGNRRAVCLSRLKPYQLKRANNEWGEQKYNCKTVSVVWSYGQIKKPLPFFSNLQKRREKKGSENTTVWIKNTVSVQFHIYLKINIYSTTIYNT